MRFMCLLVYFTSGRSLHAQCNQLTELLFHRLQVIIIISMSNWSHEGMWHAKRFLAVCRSILVLGVHTNFHLPKKPHEAVYMAFLVSRSTYHGINRQSFDMVARQHGSFSPAKVARSSITACLEFLFSNPNMRYLNVYVVSNSSPICLATMWVYMQKNFYVKERSLSCKTSMPGNVKPLTLIQTIMEPEQAT